MKTFKLYLSLLLLIVLGLSSGCKEDFDMPPLNVPVAKYKANTTIAAIKEKYWQDAVNYIDTIKVAAGAEPVVIKGTVISSDATGNIYKNLVIQDETGALAMSINANSLYTTYRLGQEVVINLSNMYIGKYAGLQQLGTPDFKEAFGWQTTFMSLAFFEEHAELNGLPNVADIDTISTYKNQPLTIGGLPTLPAEIRGMQSQLVRFDDVEFEGGGTLTYSDPNASVSRILKDSKGNSIDVRNSNYATFKNEILPKGKGSVVGILSVFNAKWQLLIRSTADCMGFGNVKEGSKEKPYTVARAIALQGTSTKGWMTGYIVGAVAPEVTKVKSNADIQWKSGTDLDNTIVIGATPETKDIKDCIVMSLPQGSAMRAALNLATNPTVYKKQVKVTGLLASYMETYGLTDNNGSASEFVIDSPTPPTPGGDGDGSAESPFLVSQILSGSKGTGVWVKGYIVGYVEGMVLDAAGAKFSASTGAAKVYSNIMMAADPATTDFTQCIPVQLPSGSDARTAINVADNPDNIGKMVSIKANVEKYFGTEKALKGASEYSFGGPVPPPTPTDPVTSLNEDFTDATTIASLIGWKAVQVTGDKAWYIYSYKAEDKITILNKYASMTGYNGKSAPFDAWLMTPALDVAKAKNKNISFETLVNGYNSTSTTFEVYVMSTNDPATAKKTKLNPKLATPPATGYSDQINSGNIDLSTYGSVVYIGFNYKATDTATASWGVDNVKFGL